MPKKRFATTLESALSPIGETSVATLAGVGPAVAEKLAVRGLLTLQDLWLHLPLRYDDRTQLLPIAALVPGTPAQVEGRVMAVERGFRYRPQLRVAISDESHAILFLRFFHFSGAQAAQFQPGRRVRCFGEARPGSHGLEIVHPSYRLLTEGEAAALPTALDPVYPAVEGIGPGSLARIVGCALDRLPPTDALELLPAALCVELGLPSLCAALLQAHRPPPDTDVALFASGHHPALQRLAFEELLAHQLSLRRQRIALRAHGATPIRASGKLAQQLAAQLPYRLTAAQARVLAEVVADMACTEPMLRLVQGDVGLCRSGCLGN